MERSGRYKDHQRHLYGLQFKSFSVFALDN